MPNPSICRQVATLVDPEFDADPPEEEDPLEEEDVVVVFEDLMIVELEPEPEPEPKPEVIPVRPPKEPSLLFWL